MHSISVSRKFDRHGPITDKAAAVMRMFSVTADTLRTNSREYGCEVEIENGDVVFITGPSGSGKSTLLRQIERSVARGQRVNLDDIELPGDRTVIDCIPGRWLSGVKLLSQAGLSDVFCLLNRAANLSEGQHWRLRLAMGLASDASWIFADEYCSGLDRISAMVISHNISKFARRTGRTFVLAASNRDTVCQLRPDIIIEQDCRGSSTVTYRDPVRQNRDACGTGD